jgi:hypothetical protein
MGRLAVTLLRALSELTWIMGWPIIVGSLFDPIARRMGGAKRYPSIGACADDGFREEINPSYKTTPTDLRAQPNLLNGIKLMLPVQSHLQKYSGSLLTQITCISHAVSSRWRGVSRSSRTRGGMRWTQGALLTKAPTADGEVVWS